MHTPEEYRGDECDGTGDNHQPLESIKYCLGACRFQVVTDHCQGMKFGVVV